MTFDIIVFDEDELPDGSLGMKQHVENGVHSNSRKELIGLYAMAGQKIKIIREYNGNSNEAIQATVQNVQSKNCENVVASSSNPQAIQANAIATNKNHVEAPIAPKYFKVAGIECKLDNNKLYQKQWMKLSQTDAESYRIISDSNNKIVPLNGKHIEKLAWVLVEDDGNQETANA